MDFEARKDPMATQWDEEQILEQRGMEGNPGQFEVMRRAPELVVQ